MMQDTITCKLERVVTDPFQKLALLVRSDKGPLSIPWGFQGKTKEALARSIRFRAWEVRRNFPEVIDQDRADDDRLVVEALYLNQARIEGATLDIRSFFNDDGYVDYAVYRSLPPEAFRLFLWGEDAPQDNDGGCLV